MQIIPYTSKRVVFRAAMDATIAMARTKWGRRRTEQFFAKFLYDRKSVADCAGEHPIIVARYAKASRMREYDPNPEFVSSSPLSDTEFDYLLMPENRFRFVDAVHYAECARATIRALRLEYASHPSLS